MQSRLSAQQKAIYCRDDVKDFYMTKNNKAAGCGDTHAGLKLFYKHNNNPIRACLKAAFYGLAPYLIVLGLFDV